MRKYLAAVAVALCMAPLGSAEVIFNNAEKNGLSDEGLITGPRVGGGFYSEVQAGNSTAGFNVISGTSRIGDDFSIDRNGVFLSKATLFAYQTNALAPSITGAVVRIRRGGSTGAIVATGTFVSAKFGSIYRIFNGSPDSSRRIQVVTVSFNHVELTPDDYFISMEFTGSGGFTGPFAPPLTKVGATSLPGANGLTQSGTNPWGPLNDGTNRQEVPFILEGVECASKLYAYDTTSRQIREVNPVNGTSTLFATMPAGSPILSGWTYDSYRQDIFAISSSTDMSYRVEPLSGLLDPQGPLLLTPSPIAHGIENNRGSNYGSASSVGGDRFFFIEGPSGEAFVRGNLGVGNNGFNNFGYNLRTNTMYMTNSSTDSLYEVDYINGTASLIGPLNGPTNPNSMAYYPDTNQMFVTENNGNLWSVDMSTGSSLFVGDIASSGNWIGLYCVNDEIGRPSDYDITAGTYFGGNFASLLESDDDRLYILCDEDNPLGILEFTVTYCEQDWYTVHPQAETVSTRDDITEFLELYRNDTNVWQTFGVGSFRTTSLTESSFGFNLINIGTTSRYVTPQRTLRARLRYVPQTDLEVSDGWSLAIDRVRVDRSIRQ